MKEERRLMKRMSPDIRKHLRAVGKNLDIYFPK